MVTFNRLCVAHLLITVTTQFSSVRVQFEAATGSIFAEILTKCRFAFSFQSLARSPFSFRFVPVFVIACVGLVIRQRQTEIYICIRSSVRSRAQISSLPPALFLPSHILSLSLPLSLSLSPSLSPLTCRRIAHSSCKHEVKRH